MLKKHILFGFILKMGAVKALVTRAKPDALSEQAS